MRRLSGGAEGEASIHAMSVPSRKCRSSYGVECVFVPGKHSVCCGGCAAMIAARSQRCIICNTDISLVQEGVFAETYAAE